MIYFQTKGELSTEKKERYEEAYNSYQKLLSNSAIFAVSSVLYVVLYQKYISNMAFYWIKIYDLRKCPIQQMKTTKVGSAVAQLVDC